MDLGEKLLQARLEAGLTQKALCEGIVTRNMLSQIEHGTARPSMDTLCRLASRLGKPVSYFLDEDTVTSPNRTVMAAARRAYDAGDPAAVLRALADYRSPDDTFDREKALLDKLCLLSLAEDAIGQKKYPLARELLEKAEAPMAYQIPELERRRLLLLGQIPDGKQVILCTALPSVDAELLLRAEAALAGKDALRAAEMLAAAEDHASARWNLLQGKAFFLRGQYRQAADCLTAAEVEYPRECFPLLEACFRELEDYQQAYLYACRQKER